jgi:hypothetical protein
MQALSKGAIAFKNFEAIKSEQERLPLLVLFPESSFHPYQIFYLQALCSPLAAYQACLGLRTSPGDKIFNST